MAKLFKTKLRNGGRSAIWRGKIRVGLNRHLPVSFCTDKSASASMLATLQAAVDRKNAGLPVGLEILETLPRRLCEKFELVSELAAARRRSYSDNCGDYIRELETRKRDAVYIVVPEKATYAAANWRG